jgi:hypothetical protein
MYLTLSLDSINSFADIQLRCLTATQTKRSAPDDQLVQFMPRGNDLQTAYIPPILVVTFAILSTNYPPKIE